MKILFVHLPRTAGTFIRGYGRETKYINYYANKGQRDGHLPASKIDKPDEWFKFGLIRNPFDWYVSQYFYFQKKKESEEGIFKGADKGLFGTKFIAEFPTFKDWIEYGVKSKLPYFWLSNVYDYMFCDKNSKLLLDYVGRYENLYDEVNKVFKLNGVKPKLKLEDFEGNRNESKHKRYIKYYKDFRLIEIISTMDRKILETYTEYGY